MSAPKSAFGRISILFILSALITLIFIISCRKLDHIDENKNLIRRADRGFKSALNLTLKKNHFLALDKNYLLQVYYNNSFSCIYKHDTTNNKLISIDKEVLKFLNNQVIAIEKSFSQISFDEK